jgi:diacylglycerol kinase (ATP)
MLDIEECERARVRRDRRFDGLLDVVVVKGESKSQLVAAMGLVYTGQHLKHSAVQIMRGRRIVAEPLVLDRPVLLDVDGEVPGRLPVAFEVHRPH